MAYDLSCPHCRRMREEVDELRETLRQLQQKDADENWIRFLKLGLTPRESQALSAIAFSRTEVASNDCIFNAMYGLELDADVPSITIVKVIVCKIRKKLESMGVSIITRWGYGYTIPPSSKQKLLEMTGGVSQQNHPKKEATEAAKNFPTSQKENPHAG